MMFRINVNYVVQGARLDIAIRYRKCIDGCSGENGPSILAGMCNIVVGGGRFNVFMGGKRACHH